MLRKKTTDGTTESSALFSAEATVNKTARFQQKKLKRSHSYCVTIATIHVILEKHAGKSTENRQIGIAASRVMKIPGWFLLQMKLRQAPYQGADGSPSKAAKTQLLTK